MKKIFVLIISVLFFQSAFTQEIISGKSKSTRLVLSPEYKRGLPPNLYVNMTFEDDNKNGILEANESAVLKLNITNKGKGPAQGLVVNVNDNIYDPQLKIKDGKKVPFIYPDQTVEVIVPIHAGFNIKSAEHKLTIDVEEHFGYDMDAALLYVNTLKFLEPELVFSGLDIIDVGEGTGAIVADGQLQPGEQVKVKIVVQNIGQNISKNTEYSVVCADANIYIENGNGKLGDLSIGEVKEFY